MMPFCLTGQNSESTSIKIGYKQSIYSKILKEERRISVYLPPSHKDSSLVEKYPVLFLLDSDLYFHLTTGIIEYSKGTFKMPEMIIVGIESIDRIKELTPTNSNKNMHGKRIKGIEHSGGGALFINFLKEELMPHIDTSFRASDFRIFAGHSLGGLLGSQIFTTNNELFQAYILIDPSLWWDDAWSINQTRSFFNNHKSLKSTLYFAEAGNALDQNNAPHITAMKAYQELLAKNASNNFTYKHNLFKSETHASVGVLGIYHGLSFIFHGYRPVDSVFQKPHLVQNHYKKLSKQYGRSFLPSESLIRNLGWGAQYGEQNLNKAIGFFSLNVKLYPHSANAYEVLGKAYEIKGDKINAGKSFQRSLELASKVSLLTKN